MAGCNLTENSSGQSKSGTSISRRGRKQLRALLYRMAMVMAAGNSELKQLYRYLRTCQKNPLKDKQTIVVISKKIVTIIYQMMKTRTEYRPVLVLGAVRKEQLGLAA
jgi:transposase